MNIVVSERLARLLYPQTLAFIGVMTIFLIIISWLVRTRAMLQFDLRVTRYLQKSGNPFWNVVNKWLTFMGNSTTSILLALGVLAVAYAMGTTRAGIYAVATLVAHPINVVLKNIFDRKRPGEDEVQIFPGPRWGFSYPSGHAMISTAFYGFVAVLIWLHVVPMPTRLALMAPFILLPPLIATSRVYLGAHWLSDVVGGMTGGMIIVVILAALYSPF
jgi:undecaprenyl-diphosphatase